MSVILIIILMLISGFSGFLLGVAYGQEWFHR